MEKVKSIFDPIVKKLKSSNKYPSLKSLWKLIVISNIIFVVFIVIIGWMVYVWVINTTPAIVMNKRVRPSITLEEIKKANDIVNSKKNKLDNVLEKKVEIVGLR